MKIPALLALGATALFAPTFAHAQVLPPGNNPGVQNQAAQRAQQSEILYWYNLLPANIFGAFGDANRLDLLQSQGAIYDKNRGFIEILAPGDPNENDVEKLQVKLYQGQQGIMVGVSQIVWNQPRVQGALAFFALDNNGQLLPVTRQVFPYDLTLAQTDTPAATQPPRPPRLRLTRICRATAPRLRPACPKPKRAWRITNGTIRFSSSATRPMKKRLTKMHPPTMRPPIKIIERTLR